MKRFTLWLADHMAGTYTSLAILAIFVSTVFAATTYDVHNVPPMTLKDRITTTDTTGIQVNPPKRNGVDVTFPTTSGGVLEFTQGNKTEHIYYSEATVNATTLVVTLTGTIIRSLDWDNCDEYVTDSNEQIFTPGASVKLVNDCRLFNLKANIDRANTMIGSGRITSNQTTQTWLNPTPVTTVERDAFTYKAFGDIVANETTGTLDYYDGITWYPIATETGALVNATESVRGVVELATVAEQGTASATGSTAASLVPQVKNLIKTSSGAGDENKIVILNSSGKIANGFYSQGIEEASIFGDGSDGTYSLDGTQTTITGSFVMMDSTNYALAKDVQFVSLTIGTGITLHSSGYVLRVSGTLTMSGSTNIHASGYNGVAGAAAGNRTSPGAGGAAAPAAYTSGTLQDSLTGVAGTAGGNGGQNGNGSAGTVGTAGTAATTSVSQNGVIGAVGGAGGTATGDGGAGGVAGAAGAASISNSNLFKHALAYVLGTDMTQLDLNMPNSGGSSGGGGGGTTNNGGDADNGGSGGGAGGGGSPGGYILLYASTITGSGNIVSIGGDGAIGGAGGVAAGGADTLGSAGGGGGGAGGSAGNGGDVDLFYKTSTWTGSFTLTGGTGGAGGAGGAGDDGGDAGAAGAAGTAGTTGISRSYQITQ